MMGVFMQIIDFIAYRANKIAVAERARGEREAEILRRQRLERVLTELLAELQAA
jgi:hypothetical protein